MKIVLASNNKHKIKEFKDILKGIEILSLNDIGFNDSLTHVDFMIGTEDLNIIAKTDDKEIIIMKDGNFVI